jgi:hypothetical protein
MSVSQQVFLQLSEPEIVIGGLFCTVGWIVLASQSHHRPLSHMPFVTCVQERVVKKLDAVCLFVCLFVCYCPWFLP